MLSNSFGYKLKCSFSSCLFWYTMTNSFLFVILLGDVGLFSFLHFMLSYVYAANSLSDINIYRVWWGGWMNTWGLKPGAHGFQLLHTFTLLENLTVCHVGWVCMYSQWSSKNLQNIYIYVYICIYLSIYSFEAKYCQFFKLLTSKGHINLSIIQVARTWNPNSRVWLQLMCFYYYYYCLFFSL